VEPSQGRRAAWPVSGSYAPAMSLRRTSTISPLKVGVTQCLTPDFIFRFAIESAWRNVPAAGKNARSQPPSPNGYPESEMPAAAE
jgi:hypothetical protein